MMLGPKNHQWWPFFPCRKSGYKVWIQSFWEQKSLQSKDIDNFVAEFFLLKLKDIKWYKNTHIIFGWPRQKRATWMAIREELAGGLCADLDSGIGQGRRRCCFNQTGYVQCSQLIYGYFKWYLISIYFNMFIFILCLFNWVFLVGAMKLQ